jgi:hypothetical protein
VKIGDVEIDQHFFVQETSSQAVILGEPYIMAARMETKVLDNGSAYARIKSQDGRHSVQFLTVPTNHERNRETIGGKNRGDF